MPAPNSKAPTPFTLFCVVAMVAMVAVVSTVAILIHDKVNINYEKGHIQGSAEKHKPDEGR